MTATRMGGARWIVLTPTPQDAAWRQALAAAATEAGLTLIDAHPDHPASLLDDPAVVVLAREVTPALSAGVQDFTALLPDPEHSPRSTTLLYSTPSPQNLWHGSRFLAEAASLPATCRVLGAEALIPGRSVELLTGFVLRTPSAAISPLDDEHARAAATSLRLYRSGRPTPGDPPASWAPVLFSYDERAARDGAAAGELDITGRPRILVYGPYIYLPVGLWRAIVRFCVDQEAASRQFRLDWGTQTDCASHTFTPGAPGVYEIELDYRWAVAAASEIRLIIMEGVFSGTMTFLGATVANVRPADEDGQPDA